MIDRLIPYRKAIYTIFLLAISGGLCIYLFVLQPMMEEIEMKEVELERATTEANEYLTQLELIQPEESMESLEALSQSIPVTPTVEQIIRDIEQLEIETQTTIENISFEIIKLSSDESEAPMIEILIADKKEEHEGIDDLLLSKVSFTIDLNGGYSNIKEFIKGYNDFPRTVRLDEITFKNNLQGGQQASNSSPSIPEMDATLSFTAYYIDQFAPFIQDR